MNKKYQEPILEIRTFESDDVVRTSDNYGFIPNSWKDLFSSSGNAGGNDYEA